MDSRSCLPSLAMTDWSREGWSSPPLYGFLVQIHLSFPFLKLIKPWFKKASPHQQGEHPMLPSFVPSDHLFIRQQPFKTHDQMNHTKNELLPTYSKASIFPCEKVFLVTLQPENRGISAEQKTFVVSL